MRASTPGQQYSRLARPFRMWSANSRGVRPLPMSRLAVGSLIRHDNATLKQRALAGAVDAVADYRCDEKPANVRSTVELPLTCEVSHISEIDVTVLLHYGPRIRRVITCAFLSLLERMLCAQLIGFPSRTCARCWGTTGTRRSSLAGS